jgi:hypothetical protein
MRGTRPPAGAATLGLVRIAALPSASSDQLESTAISFPPPTTGRIVKRLKGPTPSCCV